MADHNDDTRTSWERRVNAIAEKAFCEGLEALCKENATLAAENAELRAAYVSERRQNAHFSFVCEILAQLRERLLIPVLVDDQAIPEFIGGKMDALANLIRSKTAENRELLTDNHAKCVELAEKAHEIRELRAALTYYGSPEWA